jgi:hypothetical protein
MSKRGVGLEEKITRDEELANIIKSAEEALITGKEKTIVN